MYRQNQFKNTLNHKPNPNPNINTNTSMATPYQQNSYYQNRRQYQQNKKKLNDFCMLKIPLSPFDQNQNSTSNDSDIESSPPKIEKPHNEDHIQCTQLNPHHAAEIILNPEKESQRTPPRKFKCHREEDQDKEIDYEQIQKLHQKAQRISTKNTENYSIASSSYSNAPLLKANPFLFFDRWW